MIAHPPRILIGLAITLILVGIAAADDEITDPDAVLGRWETEHEPDGYSHVEIVRDGDQFTGHIVWLSIPVYAEGDPDGEAGTPILDTRNPDPSLRERPLLGLPLLYSFRFDDGDGKWVDGRIYDPVAGKEYRCKLTLKDAETLEVYGYIKVGFVKLGRDTTWKRVAAEP